MVVTRDFNIILRRSEQSGDHFFVSLVMKFKDNIDKLELADLPIKGGNWTWSNQRDTPSFFKIDRFLISDRKSVV